MRLFAVGRNPQQLYILFVETVVRVTERTNFLRSARGVVFGIKEKNDALSLKIGKLHLVAVLIFRFEIGCFITYFEHMLLGLYQMQKPAR